MSSKAYLLGPIFQSQVPDINSPAALSQTLSRRLRIPPGRPHLPHPWPIPAPKSRSKRPAEKRSNFDAFSASILERLGSVLEAQDGSQIEPKPIKIGFPSLSVSASFFTSIFDRFLIPTSSPWISKIFVFPQEKHGFSKTSLSKITSISASILMPTCLHVGLPNRRYSEIMAFQDAFKI